MALDTYDNLKTAIINWSGRDDLSQVLDDFIDIAEGLYKGTMQLWPADKGCIVTEIVVYPKKKALNVFLGGGELDQILDMHENVIEWAKAQGCECLMMTGRFGWKKPLEKHGWKTLHSSYVKEFE